MPLDREKTFQNAERLLKQGKTAQALDECRRLAEDAPKDLLMLNRLGDFLSRNNRGADAITYYEMIVEDFSASGFYPKAIAILKKIVKVDPNHTSAIVRLGEVNLKQRLPGEAKTWFLQAGEAYLRAREFGKAREVYQKLVAADPDNVVHAVKLAETTAAAGDPERAGLELVAVGGRLLAAGKSGDAERTFRRASEFLPGRPEPTLGLARCLAASGNRDEALRLADQAWRPGPSSQALAGEVFLLFETLGDTPRSEAVLADKRSDAISDDALEQAFRGALARGGIGALWTRTRPLFDRWVRERQFDRAARVLDRVALIDDRTQLDALERLVEVRKAESHRASTARAMERLARAYQAKGLTDKAAAQLASLAAVDPASPLLAASRPATGGTSPVVETPASPPSPAETAYDAPALPIGPTDHEFVSGNLTEAEVFEKYGLHREALQQLQQITARFPGHVVAQEKLVGFLRVQADRGALRDGLVALAFAKRASGDTEGARRAAAEAAAIGGIEEARREALERHALVAREVASPVPPAVPARQPARPVAAQPPRAPAKDDELEIVFDDEVDAPELPSATGNAALAEIEFYLEQGMEADALARIAAARAAGGREAALDTLEARARAAHADRAVSAAAPSHDTFDPGTDLLDDEDLSAITASLDVDFGIDEMHPSDVSRTEPESERSVGQIVDSFKDLVKGAVEAGDYRTHYELGIAYKEMGLLDDALSEFQVAAQSPEFHREARSMLGLCHWERGETEEAIRWCRAALDAPGGEEVHLSGLRYELANMLEQSGDLRGAHDLLTLVVAEEPGYRDVDHRLAALRAKLER